jgi:tellurite resistance protein TerC
VIFQYFRVPDQYQHRVLFWGILGALVMRGVMIWLGAELIHSYDWVLYVFGVFLVLTGVKMSMTDDTDEVHPERNPVLRLARRFFPFTTEYEGQRFFTEQLGRVALTPLALVLIMVETTDLVFALDSIPAIFGVTTDPFIVFTSNVFAILGLRSLYFVLAGAISYFRFLKVGLAFVLVFIGFKMLIVDWFKIPSGWSLLIVAAIIFGAILFSVVAAKRERTREPQGRAAPPPQNS